MTRTGLMGMTTFCRALGVVLVTALVLLVTAPPPAAEQEDDAGLTALDVIMQLVAQSVTHLAEAGLVPKLYSVTGGFGGPALSATASSSAVLGSMASVVSIDGGSSAAFTAFASGSLQAVSGTTSSGPFFADGFNRPLVANGQTWLDLDTTFFGPGPLSSVIEDLKLAEVILHGTGSSLEVSGAQIETSTAGVLRRKMAFSYFYAVSKGLLTGRGQGHSFVPGGAVDRQVVFEVAGTGGGGAGNFEGMAGALRAEERLLIVEVKSDGSATGEVTLAPADKQGTSTCALPGDSSPNKRKCGFIYEENQVVTATATPGAASKFDRWGGLCKGTKGTTCTFTVVGNFDKVMANFD